MAKINFTKEHFNKLQVLAVEMLFTGECITTKMGSVLNIVDLLHTTTVGTLNDIRLTFSKQIEKLENTDEWVADDTTQTKLEAAKKHKELVNLIIGYKRFLLEREANARKKAELKDKLNALKESQKTPDEKIKELESELSELENNEDF